MLQIIRIMSLKLCVDGIPNIFSVNPSPSLLSSPQGIVYNPDKQVLMVANSNTNLLSVSLSTGMVSVFAASTSLFMNPQGICYNGATYFVSNSGGNTVVAVDANTAASPY